MLLQREVTHILAFSASLWTDLLAVYSVCAMMMYLFAIITRFYREK